MPSVSFVSCVVLYYYFNFNIFVTSESIVTSESMYIVMMIENKLFSISANDTGRISSWKSKGLFDEIIKSPTASDNGLAPALSYIGNKIKIKFDGGCLKQNKIKFTQGTIFFLF